MWVMYFVQVDMLYYIECDGEHRSYLMWVMYCVQMDMLCYTKCDGEHMDVI